MASGIESPGIQNLLSKRAQEKIETLANRISSQLGLTCLFELDGSLRQGSLPGPSSAQFIPGVEPQKYRHELDFEIDLRLFFQGYGDFHSEKFLSSLAQACGSKHFARVEIDRWQRKHPALFIWIRDNTLAPLPVTWHLQVYDSYHTALSPSWPKLFSEQELLWLDAVRKHVRENDSFGPEDYFDLKGFQFLEARWRLIAGYATRRFSSPPHDLRPLIHRWLLGESIGEGLYRPLLPLPAQVRKTLVEAGSRLAVIPKAPHWVEQAEIAQEDKTLRSQFVRALQ